MAHGSSMAPRAATWRREGLPQGSPEASAAFCVLIHEAVVELHEALAGAGGGAWFIMDDGYAAGPPSLVLPAIRRFAERMEELGLVLQFGKCAPTSHLLRSTMRAQRRSRPLASSQAV